MTISAPVQEALLQTGYILTQFANNAVQSFGKLATSNIAFETAVKLQLVKPNGEPFDLEALQLACAHEVNRRVEAGIFFTEETA